MKAHLATLPVVAALAIGAGLGLRPAAAQYLPYQPNPQATAPYTGYPAGVPQGAYGQTPYTASQPQQQAYQPQQQFQYQPAVPNRYPAVAQNPYPATGYPTQGYPASPRPGYAVVAQQPGPTPAQQTPGQGEVLPGPTNNMTPGPANNLTPSGPDMNMGTPLMSGEVYHPGHTHAPMDGYPQDPSNCSPYPTTSNYGAYGGQYNDHGISGYFNQPCEPANQWFGGVYFLYMERDNPGYVRITVQADPPTDPYYPPASTTVISTFNTDYNYREGAELRFGSTFTVSGHDECSPYGQGCGSCEPAQLYAWEFAIWGIDRDIEWFSVTDFIPTDTYRMYGMINHAGLEYDNGSGYRPVNDYYDYQMPIIDDSPPVDGDIRVVSQRVRTNFSASNMELNFLRIPVCNDTSCAPVGCDYDASGYGYGYNNCAPAACAPAAPAFSMAALCGIRYFRTDDDIEIATDPWEYSGGSLADINFGWEMYHDIQLENHLVGFQLGTNMNYCVACKWNVFCDSTFGLFNNHVNHYQRVYSPYGDVRFTQTGDAASVRSEKDDLAFLGELRLGGSYDISCNWRAVLAYRAVAISGVALSTEQIKPEMSNYADVARIDSAGSIIIHGVQAGVECRY